ncbi:MAG: regulator of extracellular matrix RemA (YlzA/DUF370 family) [Mariniblastus sp.]|jgi:regulator of extracellular matrix RemA (YlzA/DUF370 family)
MATEQLLMSDAVDSAISQIDFRVLRGENVFLDTTYLRSVKGTGFVNSDYIISSLRQQLTAAQCLIQDSEEKASIIIEPRVGALGTDGHDVVYGIPQSGSLTSAAAILSSAPLPAIPEISFGKSNAQTGIAKVIVFAYDRETRQAVWQSGVARAESTSRNNWYFGAGPFQRGTIHEGTRFAGQELPPPPTIEKLSVDANLFSSETAGERRLISDSKNESTLTEPPPTSVRYERPYVFQPIQKRRIENDVPADSGQGNAVRKVNHDEPVTKKK